MYCSNLVKFIVLLWLRNLIYLCSEYSKFQWKCDLISKKLAKTHQICSFLQQNDFTKPFWSLCLSWNLQQTSKSKIYSPMVLLIKRFLSWIMGYTIATSKKHDKYCQLNSTHSVNLGNKSTITHDHGYHDYDTQFKHFINVIDKHCPGEQDLDILYRLLFLLFILIEYNSKHSASSYLLLIIVLLFCLCEQTFATIPILKQAYVYLKSQRAKRFTKQGSMKLALELLMLSMIMSGTLDLDLIQFTLIFELVWASNVIDDEF